MGSKQLCLSRFGAKNLFYRQYFGKTSYNELVFARNEFLRLVGAPNESLILIIIYSMFKYSVGIKKSFPTNYFNILYVEIMIYGQNNFARVATEPIKPI